MSDTMLRTVTANRNQISRVLLAFALLLFIGSAVSFQSRSSDPIRPEEFRFTAVQTAQYLEWGVTRNLYFFIRLKTLIPLERAVLLLVSGVAVMITGLLLNRDSDDGMMQPIDPAQTPFAPPRTNWLFAGLGAFILWMVAEANEQVVGITSLDGMSHHLQFGLIVLSIMLVTLGMGGVTFSLRRRAVKTPSAELRQELMLVGLITFIGFALRAWHLGIIRVLIDEVHYTTTALSFKAQPDVKLFTPMTDISPFPWFYSYWVYFSSETFGYNFTGARMVSAVIGALNIPALYFLARQLFDRKTAILSAILLVTFPPHLHFSRLSMLHVCDALAGLLTLGFLTRAFMTNRRLYYALGGAALGLTQYFYEGGRLLFPAVIALWLFGGFFLWRNRPAWRGLLVTVITALIIAAPVYYAISGMGTPFTGRLETAGLDGDYWKRLFSSSPDDEIFKAHVDRIINPFMLYVSVPDTSVFYGGDTPIMLVFVVPFFFMGLAYLARHWREPPALVLFLWLALPPLGTSLLLESGISVRFVVVFPAMVLTVALGIRCLPQVISFGEKRDFKLLTALVLVIAVGQVVYYFGPHLDAFNPQFRRNKPYPDGEDAIFRAAALPPETMIIIISDPVFNEGYAEEVMNYFQLPQGYEVLTPDDVTLDYLNSLSPNRPYAFFLMPHDIASADKIRTVFPQLEAPRRSRYADIIPDERELLLYYAPPYTVDSADPIDWQ